MVTCRTSLFAFTNASRSAKMAPEQRRAASSLIVIDLAVAPLHIGIVLSFCDCASCASAGLEWTLPGALACLRRSRRREDCML
eukprot:scaffold127083_cov66-Phaeocystis_antarctica.AAC.4